MKDFKKNVYLGTEWKEIHGQWVQVERFKEITRPTFNRDEMLAKAMTADPETVESILEDIKTIEEAASHFGVDLPEERTVPSFKLEDGEMISCSDYLELKYEGTH